jgi:hypothetical protein
MFPECSHDGPPDLCEVPDGREDVLECPGGVRALRGGPDRSCGGWSTADAIESLVQRDCRQRADYLGSGGAFFTLLNAVFASSLAG